MGLIKTYGGNFDNRGDATSGIKSVETEKGKNRRPDIRASRGKTKKKKKANKGGSRGGKTNGIVRK